MTGADNHPFNMTPDSIPATLDELQVMCRYHRDWVIDSINNRITAWPPIITVLCRDLDHNHNTIESMILDIPFSNEQSDNKKGTVREIGRDYYRQMKLPAAVLLASDSWVSKRPTPGLPPSEQPDRQEAIVVMAQSMRRDIAISDSLTYDRDPQGVMIACGWKDMAEVTEVHSPLLDQFWLGFFEAAATLMGIDLGAAPPPPNRPLHIAQLNPTTGRPDIARFRAITPKRP